MYVVCGCRSVAQINYSVTATTISRITNVCNHVLLSPALSATAAAPAANINYDQCIASFN
jgi:hypothetical protein